MKQSIILLLLLSHVNCSFSQQPTVKTDYLKKSKNQKKAAWILLGSGAALVITAFIIPEGEQTDVISPVTWTYVNKNDGLKGGLALTGTVAMLGSIPLFMASKRNSKKAARASVFMRMEKTQVLQTASIGHFYYPAVSLRIGM